jgi:hypothetical protein
VLIAHSCGNSVEIIQKHYLGIDKNVELANIAVSAVMRYNKILF